MKIDVEDPEFQMALLAGLIAWQIDPDNMIEIADQVVAIIWGLADEIH